jgi:hypothetical protein
MFTQIAIQVASHLQTSAVVLSSDGAATHDHTLSYPASLPQKPFGGLGATAATLKSSIVSALNGLNIQGAPMPDQGNQNSLDIIFGAVAEGTLEHLENNGQLSMAVGPTHVHTVS